MTFTIKLIRHGESEANIHRVSHLEVGDHAIGLSSRGLRQAAAVGTALGPDFVRDALIYVSPYVRTRQTLDGILAGTGLPPGKLPRVYEDPRLREVDSGYELYTDEQHDLRRLHGWFYYRFRGGESPADCFDRTSSFLDSMMRPLQELVGSR